MSPPPILRNNAHILFRKICLVFFVLLFYWTWNYHFLTGWDAGTINNVANYLAMHHWTLPNDDWGQWIQSYFSRYPNNIFILWLATVCKTIELKTGLFDVSSLTTLELAITCFITVFTSYLVYKIARKFLSFNGAICTWAIYLLYIALSPWTTIFYSDSLGLLFPTLLFYLYIRESSSKVFNIIRWPIIYGLGAIAYRIKPQTFIILIAISIIHLCLRAHFFVIDIKVAFTSFLLFIILLQVPNVQVRTLNIQLDAEGSFGPQHFFMMGLNPETKGVYSEDDYLFTLSYSTKAERSSADIARAKERLKSYSINGYLHLLHDKILITYADGTFAWGAEGSFWNEIFPEPNTSISYRVRSLYYPDGNHRKEWATYSQVFWLTILFFSTFSALALKSHHRIDIAILQLSTIGLFFFEMLFEVRARYIYTYAPIFLILAAIGVKSIFDFAKAHIVQEGAVK